MANHHENLIRAPIVDHFSRQSITIYDWEAAANKNTVQTNNRAELLEAWLALTIG